MKFFQMIQINVLCVFILDVSKMPVAVSHNIDLGPDLPNEVMDIARKQGEDPERLCADIQELRDMIFGKNEQHSSYLSFFSILIDSRFFSRFYTERGTCVPPRTDDDFLIRFLRARYFKLEHAYNLVSIVTTNCYMKGKHVLNFDYFVFQLCRYCEFRESNPELHIDVHPFLLTKLGEDDIVSVTPYRDQNGNNI